MTLTTGGRDVVFYDKPVLMQCPDDMYDYDGNCKDCEEGMTCPVGTTLKTIQVDPGYWRLHGASREVLKCIREGCKGSSANATVNVTDNLCEPGYTAPLCNVVSASSFVCCFTHDTNLPFHSRKTSATSSSSSTPQLKRVQTATPCASRATPAVAESSPSSFVSQRWRSSKK
jgi:hypothetical protein